MGLVKDRFDVGPSTSYLLFILLRVTSRNENARFRFLVPSEATNRTQNAGSVLAIGTRPRD